MLTLKDMRVLKLAAIPSSGKKIRIDSPVRWVREAIEPKWFADYSCRQETAW